MGGYTDGKLKKILTNPLAFGVFLFFSVLGGVIGLSQLSFDSWYVQDTAQVASVVQSKVKAVDEGPAPSAPATSTESEMTEAKAEPKVAGESRQVVYSSPNVTNIYNPTTIIRETADPVISERERIVVRELIEVQANATYDSLDSFASGLGDSFATESLTLSGTLTDASGSAGESGYILQSTGTGTAWVATSTLGFTGGGGTPSDGSVSSSTLAALNWQNGYILQASSTAASGFDWVATSTLGISGSGTVTSVAASVPTGWTIANSPITTTGTLAFDYAAGYAAVLTASTTAWNSFYDTPSSRISAGDGLSWSGNTLNAEVQSSDLNNYLSLANWYATTTDALSEGATNFYYSENRFTSSLAATSSVASITALTNLATVGTITSGTWNGTAIDISDYTNLAVGATGLTLSADTIALTAGYTIPLTASTTEWASAYSNSHVAATLAGEDYLSLSGQEITAAAINPDNLASADFGDFTCNGTSCSLDADTVGANEIADADYGDFTFSGGSATLDANSVSDNEIDYTTVTLNDLTFDVNSVDKTEFGYLNGVTSGIQSQLDSKIAIGTSSVASITTLANLTTVGALNSGSITSGFGNIDIGSSNLDADGTITFGGISNGVVQATSGVLSATSSISSSFIEDVYLRNDGDTASGDYNFDSNTLFVDSGDNRVGIGTTTPQRALDVNGSVRIASGSVLEFGQTAAKNYIASTDVNNYLAFGTNSGERVRITSAGNVGIGTTDPIAKNHIYGANTTNVTYTNGDATGGTLYLQDSGVVANNGGQILFGASQGIFGNIKGVLQNGTGPAGAITIGTRTTSGNVLERMRVDSNGNIGIADSTPTEATLTVGGTFYVLTNTAVGSDPLCWDGSGGSLHGDCSSLAKWKTNVEAFEAGLTDILALEAVNFDWKRNADGTLSDSNKYDVLDADTGFIADQVASVNYSFGRYDAETGALRDVNDRAIMGALVNAIKELYQNVEEISSYFVDGVLRIVSAEIDYIQTRELCIADDEGTTCIDRQKLEEILENSGTSGSNGSLTAGRKAAGGSGSESLDKDDSADDDNKSQVEENSDDSKPDETNESKDENEDEAEADEEGEAPTENTDVEGDVEEGTEVADPDSSAGDDSENSDNLEKNGDEEEEVMDDAEVEETDDSETESDT